MEESARLLVRKYDFTAADLDHYIDFAIDRYQTPGIKDPIARVVGRLFANWDHKIVWWRQQCS